MLFSFYLQLIFSLEERSEPINTFSLIQPHLYLFFLRSLLPFRWTSFILILVEQEIKLTRTFDSQLHFWLLQGWPLLTNHSFLWSPFHALFTTGLSIDHMILSTSPYLSFTIQTTLSSENSYTLCHPPARNSLSSRGLIMS